nr:LexA family transcriptional regulator [Parvibaculum indicum]
MKELGTDTARGDRIAQARKAKRFTQEGLAKVLSSGRETKISRGAVGNWERGYGLTTRNLNALAKILNVDETWLLTGNGKGPGEKSRTTRSGNPDPTTDHLSSAIPEVDVRGGMGFGGDNPPDQFTMENGHTIKTDSLKGQWHFPDEYLAEVRVRAGRMRIIEVQGDSMETPDGGGLHSGDRVMIDISDHNPTPPGIFAVWDGFGVVVKRIERVPQSDPPAIRLISDNPLHEPYMLTADEAGIIGRVVWFARRL